MYTNQENSWRTLTTRRGRGGLKANYPSEWNISAGRLSERNVALIDDYVNDEESNKTFARRCVERTFSKLKWYNPNRDREGLDLRKGWAFYDHFTLARYRTADSTDNRKPMTNRRHEFKHVDPGSEGDSTTYSFFTTPFSAYKEWGIGVALYFHAMIIFAVALCIAGITSIPNILFFSSMDYHNMEFEQGLAYRGSAVCSSAKWVLCEDGFCDHSMMNKSDIPYAIAFDEKNITLVQKSLCEGAVSKTIFNNYATITFLAFFTIFFAWYQNALAVRLDEDLLTASDYSIHVKNPPPDATDPSEWRDFFMKYAEGPDKHVAACTIIINNEQLIWQLINRRICRDELRKLFPDTDIDDEGELSEALEKHIEQRDAASKSCLDLLFNCTLRPILNLVNRFVRAEKLIDKVDFYNDKIKELQQKSYEVIDVFITFETEVGQRNALEVLSTGKLNLRSNNSSSDLIDVENLFRGKVVLDVGQPTEPSAVRYQDLAISPMSKSIRYFIATIITLGLVALSAFLVNETRTSIGPFAAGILTSLLNLLVPLIIKLLLLIEKHNTEGDSQKSLYTKVTAFRWLITVIMTKFLTNYTDTLGDDSDSLLPAVFYIFVSEAILVPVLRYLDIGGFLSKHYFAPRATTQDQMYLCFKGTPYNLAERYTDLSKIVFLSYYYCALYPATLFFGSLTLALRYYTDKFLLLHTWRSAPYFGSQLADFSLKFFFTLAATLCALVSAFDYVYFPFDHICEGKEDLNAQAVTYTNVKMFNFRGEEADSHSIEFSGGGNQARVCNSDSCCQEQDFWKKLGIFTPWNLQNDEFYWMSPDDKETYARTYAWTAFCLIMGYVVLQLGGHLMRYTLSFFRVRYQPEGQPQYIDFSCVDDIDGYVPQVIFPRFPFPLLLCDVKDIEPGFLGWKDPTDSSYRQYSVLSDVDEVNAEVQVNPDGSIKNIIKTDGPLFSIVKQWNRNFDTNIS